MCRPFCTKAILFNVFINWRVIFNLFCEKFLHPDLMIHFFFQIIYEINYCLMEELKKILGQDYDKLSRMSIIEEGAVKV